MKVRIQSKELLSQLLPALDMRCGGRGTCGKCKVQLLTGSWESSGRIIEAPAAALACRTRLAGNEGLVELPDAPAASVETMWRNTLPLPDNPEPVLALDIGTTTLAMVRIEHGKTVAFAGALNGQFRFGDNVIDRIVHAGKDLPTLRKALFDSVEPLLKELESSECVRIGVAGNTVMSCILHNINPASIGVSPFTPPERIFPVRNDLFGNLETLTVPAISGYLGGDLTAGLFESRPEPGDLLVDLGTNCEMIFYHDSGFTGSAAAAGPAFEGAGLACGSRAVPGAITAFHSLHDFDTIGNAPPCGICGTGFADLLAVLKQSGKLDKFGRLYPAASCCEIAPGIVITESEIEQLLKAKAAVIAGVRSLEAACGTPVRRLLLSGAFGHHLNLQNAVLIGLLPDLPAVRFGNLALAGAARLAAAPESAAQFTALIDRVTELPCAGLPGFAERFADGLLIQKG